MSTNVISPVQCTSAGHRPLIDVLVEKFARRLLSWSERPVREPRQFDPRRLDALANERAIATARPLRWY